MMVSVVFVLRSLNNTSRVRGLNLELSTGYSYVTMRERASCGARHTRSEVQSFKSLLEWLCSVSQKFLPALTIVFEHGSYTKHS